MPKNEDKEDDLNVRIYIPTLGRVGINRQVTLREFKEYSSHNPALVCPLEEVRQHEKYHDWVIPCTAKGIGPTRQFIIEYSRADVVIVASDDMRFSYRPVPEEVKLERCTNLDPLVDLIIDCIKQGYIHGGVGARQGNNRKNLSTPRKGIIRGGHLFQDNERVNDFHFFNREAVLNTGARFDAIEVMEDFHLTLTLLTQGYPNTVIHDYVWNQEGSSKAGGCSLYRTPEVQTRSALALQEAFPDFVKVVTKVSKETSTAWKNFKERTDVIVQWLKAFESSSSQPLRAQRLDDHKKVRISDS